MCFAPAASAHAKCNASPARSALAASSTNSAARRKWAASTDNSRRSAATMRSKRVQAPCACCASMAPVRCLMPRALPTRPPQRHGARDGAAPGRQAQRSRVVLLTTQRQGRFTAASADLPTHTSAAQPSCHRCPSSERPRLRAKINRRRVSSNQRKKAEAPLLPGKDETAVSTPEKRGFESPFTIERDKSW